MAEERIQRRLSAIFPASETYIASRVDARLA
jgi:hypothetical protein